MLLIILILTDLNGINDLHYQKPISLIFLINLTWSFMGILIALICASFKSTLIEPYFSIWQEKVLCWL